MGTSLNEGPWLQECRTILGTSTAKPQMGPQSSTNPYQGFLNFVIAPFYQPLAELLPEAMQLVCLGFGALGLWVQRIGLGFN